MARLTMKLTLRRWLARCLAAGALGFLSLAQAGTSGAPPPTVHTTAAAKAATAKPAAVKVAETYRASAHSDKARRVYAADWGIDHIEVRGTSSGQLIRFSYRVVDAKKAQVLDDKKATPHLFDAKAKAVLEVPTMDKIGQLRQSSSPENGKEYWMVFSNKGGHVKAGDRVNIVIGPFHVEGLAVL
jgi:pyruvate/2-oxoglutarate dehydrogenase complex dihydrolipoamide acyltransferase (E2) component